MCDNGIASQNSTINSDIFNATLNASAAQENITYTPTPHMQPSKMALDVAIESAPLDIKPLLDNRQNVSSEFCSGSVKTDSFACATKLTLTDIVQLFVAHRIPVLSEHNLMVMTALLKLQDGVVSTQENYFLRSQS